MPEWLQRVGGQHSVLVSVPLDAELLLLCDDDAQSVWRARLTYDELLSVVEAQSDVVPSVSKMLERLVSDAARTGAAKANARPTVSVLQQGAERRVVVFDLRASAVNAGANVPSGTQAPPAELRFVASRLTGADAVVALASQVRLLASARGAVVGSTTASVAPPSVPVASLPASALGVSASVMFGESSERGVLIQRVGELQQLLSARQTEVAQLREQIERMRRDGATAGGLLGDAGAPDAGGDTGALSGPAAPPAPGAPGANKRGGPRVGSSLLNPSMRRKVARGGALLSE